MKLHILENQSKIEYPVGYNMQDAIMFIINVIDKIAELVEKKQFPTKNIDIWVRGSSGAILGGLLCQQLLISKFTNISVIHIKKEGESSHDTEYYKTNGKYNIVIDDFISSGETMDEISLEAKKYVKYIDLLIVSKIRVIPKYEGHIGEYSDSEILSVDLPHFIPKALICGMTSKLYPKHLRKLKPTNLTTYDFTK